MSQKQILISTLGQTPHTVTEVVGELERRGVTLTEVHTIQTKGSSPISQKVMEAKPDIRWHTVEIPYADILTPKGAASAQATICQTIYHQKRRGDVAALHLDLTGGRKTMSAYMMFAVQLFCDDHDFLWHVSANDKFMQSQRWYPEKEGDVNLLQIPFIPLDLLVQSIQEHVNPQLDAANPQLDVANPAVVIEKSVEVLEDLALLGLMARGVDHETNNDLNDVLHRLGRIQKQLPTDSPVMGEVKHILADLQNVEGIIESFLAVGDPQRVAAGFQEVRLRPLITEVLDALSEIYDLYDYEIDGPDFEVAGDALLLKRLFRIVLTNAQKHAKCRRVRIHLADDPQGCTVTITDDGVGMSPEQVDQAFALFKPHPSTSTGKRVGLAVARRIAQLHGGDLQIQSEIGRSTAVVFRFPKK